jgi:hypothetical protein
MLTVLELFEALFNDTKLLMELRGRRYRRRVTAGGLLPPPHLPNNQRLTATVGKGQASPGLGRLQCASIILSGIIHTYRISSRPKLTIRYQVWILSAAVVEGQCSHQPTACVGYSRGFSHYLDSLNTKRTRTTTWWGHFDNMMDKYDNTMDEYVNMRDEYYNLKGEF